MATTSIYKNTSTTKPTSLRNGSRGSLAQFLLLPLQLFFLTVMACSSILKRTGIVSLSMTLSKKYAIFSFAFYVVVFDLMV